MLGMSTNALEWAWQNGIRDALGGGEDRRPLYYMLNLCHQHPTFHNLDHATNTELCRDSRTAICEKIREAVYQTYNWIQHTGGFIDANCRYARDRARIPFSR